VEDLAGGQLRMNRRLSISYDMSSSPKDLPTDLLREARIRPRSSPSLPALPCCHEETMLAEWIDRHRMACYHDNEHMLIIRSLRTEGHKTKEGPWEDSICGAESVLYRP